MRLRDPLITLAMIVGADIEVAVSFASVPANDLIPTMQVDIPGADALRVEFGIAQPATGNDGVRLEQLDGTGGAHFRRDHAGDVLFERHVVDDGEPFTLKDSHATTKNLSFFSLPVKTDANRNVVDGKRGIRGVRVIGAELDCRIEAMPSRGIEASRTVRKGSQHQLDGIPSFHQPTESPMAFLQAAPAPIRTGRRQGLFSLSISPPEFWQIVRQGTTKTPETTVGLIRLTRFKTPDGVCLGETKRPFAASEPPPR
jgi:hypothetical protein